MANGVVYIGSIVDHVGALVALDASTGVQLWSNKMGNEGNASPSVADGVVYMGSLDHHVYAFGL